MVLLIHRHQKKKFCYEPVLMVSMMGSMIMLARRCLRNILHITRVAISVRLIRWQIIHVGRRRTIRRRNSRR